MSPSPPYFCKMVYYEIASSPSPFGDIMILKFKYHDDTGLLEAYQSYILAQNTSNSHTVAITSTANDADKYEYCLEFVCYNSKNIPKAQYISPILQYSDGITFTLPNNLTEYKGHVDMQLTGFLPDDNTVVFKSIAKDCKAFDVEGSLNVLESDLGETPNLLTEVMKELERLEGAHDEIIELVNTQFDSKYDNMIKSIQFHKVTFYVIDMKFKEVYVVHGGTVQPPEFDEGMLEGFINEGKWYDSQTDTEYSPDLPIESDMNFILNVYAPGMTFDEDGYMTSFVPDPAAYGDLVFPEMIGGKRFKGIASYIDDINLSERINYLYISSKMNSFCNIHKLNTQINYIVVQPCNSMLKVHDNVLYSQNALIYYPNANTDEAYYVLDGTVEIKGFAIRKNFYLKKLYLPQGLRQINADAITGNENLVEIYIPRTVSSASASCISGNGESCTIHLEGDISQKLNSGSFGDVSKYKLMVDFASYENYKKRLSSYGVNIVIDGYDTMATMFETKQQS